MQDDREKRQETDLCEKSPVDPADTLGVKFFVKIALFFTVSEILKIFYFQC